MLRETAPLVHPSHLLSHNGFDTYQRARSVTNGVNFIAAASDALGRRPEGVPWDLKWECRESGLGSNRVTAPSSLILLSPAPSPALEANDLAPKHCAARSVCGSRGLRCSHRARLVSPKLHAVSTAPGTKAGITLFAHNFGSELPVVPQAHGRRTVHVSASKKSARIPLQSRGLLCVTGAPNCWPRASGMNSC
jgi:hypothetical protein